MLYSSCLWPGIFSTENSPIHLPSGLCSVVRVLLIIPAVLLAAVLLWWLSRLFRCTDRFKLLVYSLAAGAAYLALLLLPPVMMFGTGSGYLVIIYILGLLPWRHRIWKVFAFLLHQARQNLEVSGYQSIEFQPGRYRLASEKLLIELHPRKQEISGLLLTGRYAGRQLVELSEKQQLKLLQSTDPLTRCLLGWCSDCKVDTVPVAGELPEPDRLTAAALLGRR